MENSYIKIYRGLLDWEWYKDSKMVHLFVHLLLNANFVDCRFQGKEIKRGQIITGRKSLSNNTGITEQSIRTCLEKLVTTNEITIKTTNSYSIITIVKYEQYQSYDKKTTNKSTKNQPSTNQQLTTIKEEEKSNNNINIPSIEDFLQYAKTITEFNFSEYEYALKSKYSSWLDAGWKDGNNNKIVNWKSKLKNTYPYLKPIKNQIKTNYIGGLI